MPVGRRCLDLGAEVARFVVERGVEAEFVDQPGAFVRAAGDADHPATGDLAQLTDHRPRSAGRTRDQHGIADERLADLEQAEQGRHARGAEHAEVRRQQVVIDDFEQFLGRYGRIALPAQSAHDLVADREARRLGRHHLADPGAPHHLADLRRSDIVADVLHVTLQRRVEGEIEIADQHLAFVRFDDRRFDELEVVVGQRTADRAAIDQPLAVGVGHRGVQSQFRGGMARPSSRRRRAVPSR